MSLLLSAAPPVAEQKLIIMSPELSDYNNVETEPEFWKPVFKPEEMLYIRNTLQQISREQVWRLCETIEKNIPTYYVEKENKPKMLSGGIYGKYTEKDFTKFNFILCATFIILGIISKKLANQDYKLLFKGGKAIQLALAGIPGSSKYNSEDIDCLLMPRDGILYNLENITNLAGNIAYLVQWFLKTDNEDILVLPPRENNLIFKLSYKFEILTQQILTAFSDIDFRQIPEDTQPFFEDIVSKSFEIPELDQDLLFEYPTIESLLNEKIYYYLKYFMSKKLFDGEGKFSDPEGKIKDPKRYKDFKQQESNWFLEKFKRAILILNNTLHNGDIESMKKYIADRLNNDPLTSEIIESLYN